MSQNKLIVQQRYISHTFKVPFNDHAVCNTYYSINIINNYKKIIIHIILSKEYQNRKVPDHFLDRDRNPDCKGNNCSLSCHK